MTLAGIKWQAPPLIDPKAVQTLANKREVSPLFAQICLQRGIDDQDWDEFFSPRPQLFHDPYALYDMDKAVERIQQAIETGEEILVYGDYDADGISSTTIMVETIETMGGNCHYYLPNRFTDGYGPNQSIFDYYIKQGTGLIITVDCGIAASDVIASAMAQNCDVIVTDHHEIGPSLPPAYAIIHPRHPLGSYPFGDLSGAGVALKLAQALLEEIPYDLMEVAAIGTIADLVSITDENRSIVKWGLEGMKHTQRLGLSLLLEKYCPDLEKLDTQTIGFVLGPRFNALGRLGDASPGVQLLLTWEEEEALSIIQLMDQENLRRQSLVEEIVSQARGMVDSQKDYPLHILAHAGWHEGVLGIVASRLVEEYKKPVIVLAIQEDGLTAKGSGRSLGQVNLFQLLSQHRDLLLKFGGHHMAAGLTLETAMIPQVLEGLKQSIQALPKDAVQSTSLYDLEVNLSDATKDLVACLDQLKPFGTDNPAPIVKLTGVLSKKTQMGEGGKHLKIALSDQDKDLQAIRFQAGSWASLLRESEKMAVYGSLEINEWQNLKQVQMKLEDIQLEASPMVDWRGSQLRRQHFELDNALYFVFQPSLMDQLTDKVKASSRLVSYDQWISSVNDEDWTSYSRLVVVDCPHNKEAAQSLVGKLNNQETYIIAYCPQSIVTQGLPKRESFAKVYKYLASHQRVPYNAQTGKVAEYLSIPLLHFKWILKVFFELKFVTINNGFLVIVENPPSMDISASPLMQEMEERQWVEKVFVYSPFSQLVTWLRG